MLRMEEDPNCVLRISRHHLSASEEENGARNWILVRNEKPSHATISIADVYVPDHEGSLVLLL